MHLLYSRFFSFTKAVKIAVPLGGQINCFLSGAKSNYAVVIHTHYLALQGSGEYNIPMSKEKVTNKELENLENSKAQMRKGSLEFCILLIISRGEVYASDILKELKSADLLVVEGTLYPLLSRLKGLGLLHYTWKES